MAVSPLYIVSLAKLSAAKDNLTYLGNLPGDDLIPFKGNDYWTGYYVIGWESGKIEPTIEHYFIDQYLAWRDEL